MIEVELQRITSLHSLLPFKYNTDHVLQFWKFLIFSCLVAGHQGRKRTFKVCYSLLNYQTSFTWLFVVYPVLGCSNSQEMLSPSPLWNLRFFWGSVPIIPQNIKLSPTWRYPNFPYLSSYVLVPKNWGKLENPHFSQIITKSCIFQKKFLFPAVFRPLFEY